MHPCRFHHIFWVTISLLAPPFAHAGKVPFYKPDDYPDWWFLEDVVPSSYSGAATPTWPRDYAPADDFAVANLGQLKNIYISGADAVFGALYNFDQNQFPIEIQNMMWALDTADPDANYAVANIGQAKALAETIYAAFDTYLGPTGFRPWSGTPDDYAALNLGQLKHIFSFSFDNGGLQLGNPNSFSVGIPKVVERATGSPPTVITRTRDDQNEDYWMSGPGITDISLPFQLLNTSESVQRISTDSSVITPSSTDPTLWVANSQGQAQLRLVSNSRTVIYPVSVYNTASHPCYLVREYVQGSLIRHIHDSVAALVASKAAGESTMNILNSDGTRNPNLWTVSSTNSIDISSIVVGHTDTGGIGGWMQGVLVTPKHVIIATHVGTAIGKSFTFRRADNTGNVTRTVAALQECGNDILLVTLNAPISFAVDGVSFAKVLPSNVGDYWLEGSDGWRDQLPLLKCKRNGNHQLGLSMGGNAAKASEPRPTWMAPWYVEWYSGDSGSAVGTIINGEYIFLGNAWRGGSSEDDVGSSVLYSRSQIEAALVGSGYGLTDVSLSQFAKYR